jgi:hypothetical protein
MANAPYTPIKVTRGEARSQDVILTLSGRPHNLLVTKSGNRTGAGAARCM